MGNGRKPREGRLPPEPRPLHVAGPATSPDILTVTLWRPYCCSICRQGLEGRQDEVVPCNPECIARRAQTSARSSLAHLGMPAGCVHYRSPSLQVGSRTRIFPIN